MKEKTGKSEVWSKIVFREHSHHLLVIDRTSRQKIRLHKEPNIGNQEDLRDIYGTL